MLQTKKLLVAFLIFSYAPVQATTNSEGSSQRSTKITCKGSLGFKGHYLKHQKVVPRVKDDPDFYEIVKNLETKKLKPNEFKFEFLNAYFNYVIPKLPEHMQPFAWEVTRKIQHGNKSIYVPRGFKFDGHEFSPGIEIESVLAGVPVFYILVVVHEFTHFVQQGISYKKPAPGAVFTSNLFSNFIPPPLGARKKHLLEKEAIQVEFDVRSQIPHRILSDSLDKVDGIKQLLIDQNKRIVEKFNQKIINEKDITAEVLITLLHQRFPQLEHTLNLGLSIEGLYEYVALEKRGYSFYQLALDEVNKKNKALAKTSAVFFCLAGLSLLLL